MTESQNIEYKSNWRDEYLKWICGFANSNGGSLFVGVDDNAKVIGIKKYEELMTQLPNKFRDVLGVFAEISQTQIRLYEDQFSVWNDGGLPDGITEEDLNPTWLF